MKNTKLVLIYYTATIVWVVYLLVGIASPIVKAQQSLNNRSVKLSSSEVAASNVRYEVSFTTDPVGLTLGSIYLQFCQNSPLVYDACTAIPGFDISSATISNQSGVADFSIAPGATANSLVLTRTPGFIAGSVDVVIELSGVTNPSVTGTSYGRIQIFPTADASGPASYEGGMTFAIENPVNVSTWVPPWLFICVGVTVPGYYCTGEINSYINFGELTPREPNYATSEVIVATNATSGYVLYVTGTTLTSGNNVIPALPNPSPLARGTGQFGINLRDNSNPDVGNDKVGSGSGIVSANYNVPNRFMFNSGDYLASSPDTSLGEKYTVSYVVNVARQQNPGIYSTTLVYTVLAAF